MTAAMTAAMKRIWRRLGDRGVTVVESAFAIPLLLMFVLGGVDFGYAEFQTSQITGAARDGARVGILDYDEADVAGSDDRNAIVAAVLARLPNQKATPTITVACEEPDGTVITCSAASVDQDRIRVRVQWPYSSLTYVSQAMGTKTLTGTATMTIIGRPISVADSGTPPSTSSTTSTSTSTTSTTTPGSCAVTNVAVDPSSVQRKSNGQLQDGFTVTVTTDGSASCSALSILYYPNGTSPETKNLSGTSPTFSVTVGKNDHSNWTTGAKVIGVFQGSTQLGSGTLTVT